MFVLVSSMGLHTLAGLVVPILSDQYDVSDHRRKVLFESRHLKEMVKNTKEKLPAPAVWCNSIVAQ